MTQNGDEPESRLEAPPRPKRESTQVGYSKPPPEHRFKPGRSGNPKGRPKGAKNESTILRDILTRKIANRSGGRVRKISVLEGIHLRIADDALKGNTKSATFILNRYAALVSGELQPQDLSIDDREVLEAFAQRHEARPPKTAE
jgi:hypothetical protein